MGKNHQILLTYPEQWMNSKSTMSKGQTIVWPIIEYYGLYMSDRKAWCIYWRKSSEIQIIILRLKSDLKKVLDPYLSSFLSKGMNPRVCKQKNSLSAVRCQCFLPPGSTACLLWRCLVTCLYVTPSLPHRIAGWRRGLLHALSRSTPWPRGWRRRGPSWPQPSAPRPASHWTRPTRRWSLVWTSSLIGQHGAAKPRAALR